MYLYIQVRTCISTFFVYSSCTLCTFYLLLIHVLNITYPQYFLEFVFIFISMAWWNIKFQVKVSSNEARKVERMNHVPGICHITDSYIHTYICTYVMCIRLVIIEILLCRYLEIIPAWLHSREDWIFFYRFTQVSRISHWLSWTPFSLYWEWKDNPCHLRLSKDLEFHWNGEEKVWV